MARGVNRVTLIGNIGNDPETKYTQGGMAITSISLATSSAKKDKDGNLQERTDWHRVKMFGKLAEIAAEYLKKGSQVYIEGSIRYDKYTGTDGVEKYSTDIIADEMQMLGGRSEGQQAERPRQSAQPRNQNAGSRSSPMAPPPADDFADDDLPF
jgi:single-strand DNA-binding protein